jgi:hypothetical protein
VETNLKRKPCAEDILALLHFDLPWHWKNSQMSISVCGFSGVILNLCHLPTVIN